MSEGPGFLRTLLVYLAPARVGWRLMPEDDRRRCLAEGRVAREVRLFLPVCPFLLRWAEFKVGYEYEAGPEGAS